MRTRTLCLQVLRGHGLQERRPEARTLSGVRIAGREARVARHKPAPGVPDRLWSEGLPVPPRSIRSIG
jgi:hypothetical protein